MKRGWVFKDKQGALWQVLFNLEMHGQLWHRMENLETKDIFDTNDEDMNQYERVKYAN